MNKTNVSYQDERKRKLLGVVSDKVNDMIRHLQGVKYQLVKYKVNRTLTLYSEFIKNPISESTIDYKIYMLDLSPVSFCKLIVNNADFFFVEGEFHKKKFDMLVHEWLDSPCVFGDEKSLLYYCCELANKQMLKRKIKNSMILKFNDFADYDKVVTGISKYVSGFYDLFMQVKEDLAVAIGKLAHKVNSGEQKPHLLHNMHGLVVGMKLLNKMQYQNRQNEVDIKYCGKIKF